MVNSNQTTFTEMYLSILLKLAFTCLEISKELKERGGHSQVHVWMRHRQITNQEQIFYYSFDCLLMPIYISWKLTCLLETDICFYCLYASQLHICFGILSPSSFLFVKIKPDRWRLVQYTAVKQVYRPIKYIY